MWRKNVFIAHEKMNPIAGVPARLLSENQMRSPWTRHDNLNINDSFQLLATSA
jgi:hypothetical protein